MTNELNKTEENNETPEHPTGIFYDIPFAEYLNIKAASNSKLSNMAKCPANGLIPIKDNDNLRLGRACHTLVLEGVKQFNKEFVAMPKFDCRKPPEKILKAKFVEENSEKDIIKEDDITECVNIHKAIQAHPLAKNIINYEGKAEVTTIWKDVDTGLLCKGRLDFVADKETKTIIDLKTTADASIRGFTNSAVKFGYASQAAMYMDGLNTALGCQGVGDEIYETFIFVCVEKTAPYRVEVHTLSKEFLDWGRTRYKELLELELKCRKEGYPHYLNPGMNELELPKYLEHELSDFLAMSQ